MTINYNYDGILELLNTNGYENVKFLIKMSKIENFGIFSMRSGHDKEYVECTIRKFEDDNNLYSFPNNYKIYVDADNEVYGSENYYISDFISLLNEDIIKLVTEDVTKKITYSINVKIVRPYMVGVRKGLVLKDGKVEFSKDKKTIFDSKEEVENIMIDIFKNRKNYNDVACGGYIEMWMMRKEDHIISYGDMMSIKFS